MVNLNSKNVRILDWAFALAFLGYGIYSHSWIIGAIGVAGLWAAWYRPASRMSAFVKRAKK